MSADLREPSLYIATGKKGVGKTYATENYILKSYVMSDRKKGIKGRPVVIFDTNNEFTDVPAFQWDIEQYKPKSGNAKPVIDRVKVGKLLKQWCVDVYHGRKQAKIVRIMPFLKNGKPMNTNQKRETVWVLLECVRGGLLYLEDFNNYFTGSSNQDVIGQITTNRHKGQDMILHMQTLNKLDPNLFANCSFVRMHKQKDPVKRIKNKLPNEEMFLLAEAIIDVQYEKDPRFFLYLDLDRDKIMFYNLSAKDIKTKFSEGCIYYLTKHKQYFKEIAEIHTHKNLNSLNQREKSEIHKKFIQEKMTYIKR